MEKIFNELPIVLPFYESVKSQEIYKENVDENLYYKLISPQNSLLPFQIRMPKDKPAPTAWKIISHCGKTSIDISNNLSKVKIYEFEDFKQAVYFGEPLQFVFEQINEPLNLPCGFYYAQFEFADGSKYVSEIFYPHNNLQEFLKIVFYCNNDVLPVIYRDNWQQILYLPTYVHSSVPELEEETEEDGFNNEIPIFQKLMLRYKFVDVVPDFLKIVLVSLQMQDFVYLWLNETRSGEIDRVFVTATPDETGATNEVEVIFEDDVLVKTSCGKNEPTVSVSNW